MSDADAEFGRAETVKEKGFYILPSELFANVRARHDANLNETLYRGGAEQKNRQYLIDNNYVDAVIQLPPDLFCGTPIATCIIVLKKSKFDNAMLFIDASSLFVRSGNKNKLAPEHR
ncbi:MAG: N-6 DNA methylase [Methylomonas sp.]|nr:N-6 DNA methylase [Methylomonas sp.]